MKKLTKIQMKKISGGAPPLCVQICNYDYRFCLSQGGTSAQCQAERAACLNCECNNIC